MTFYRRNLPHLEKPGKSYFITFNTMDDLMLPDPAKSLSRRRIKDPWLSGE